MDGSTVEAGGVNIMNLDAADFDGARVDSPPLDCGTLPIDDDEGAEVDDADMKSDVGDSGARNNESSIGGFGQMQYLTTEERLAWLENELVVQRGVVEKIKSRMADLIEVQNTMTAQPGNQGKNAVSAKEFEKMVDGALKSGTKYGVSRSYITRFLCCEFQQINNRYLQKKIGMLLKKKLATNEYLLNDSLYSFNDK